MAAPGATMAMRAACSGPRPTQRNSFASCRRELLSQRPRRHLTRQVYRTGPGPGARVDARPTTTTFWSSAARVHEVQEQVLGAHLVVRVRHHVREHDP